MPECQAGRKWASFLHTLMRAGWDGKSLGSSLANDEVITSLCLLQTISAVAALFSELCL